MSDDDQDIDIESEDDNDYSDSRQRSSGSLQNYSQAEKRAHHNALERKRRDHIKDSFSSLKDTVIALKGEKVASRVQILKRAAVYIDEAREKTLKQQKNIEALRRQNFILESELHILKEAIIGNPAAKSFGGSISEILDIGDSDDSESSDSSESESEIVVHHSKKLKINSSR